MVVVFGALEIRKAYAFYFQKDSIIQKKIIKHKECLKI